MTRRLILVTLVLLFVVGCSIKWTNPFDSDTELEQTGRQVKATVQTAMTAAYLAEPGEWATHVCATADIVLKALDGDSEAIEAVNRMLNERELNYDEPVAYISGDMDKKMSIELRNLLLGLLSYTAEIWDMHGWDAVAAGAIGIIDAFLTPEVITDYAVWYLTREFFAGIVDGCALI